MGVNTKVAASIGYPPNSVGASVSGAGLTALAVNLYDANTGTVAKVTDNGDGTFTQVLSATTSGGQSASGAALAGNPVRIGGSDGTNAQDIRTASAANQTAATAAGAVETVGPPTWSVIHVPATAVQATASKAAGGAGVRHVCTSITVIYAAGASAIAAAAPLVVSLIDGASGGTTYLWRAYVNIPATAADMRSITISGLNLIGSAATAMTLEFSAAGGTNSYQSVTISGYDVS